MVGVELSAVAVGVIPCKDCGRETTVAIGQYDDLLTAVCSCQWVYDGYTLEDDCFVHGQLCVSCSRVESANQLYIYILGKTANVVFKDILYAVPHQLRIPEIEFSVVPFYL